MTSKDFRKRLESLVNLSVAVGLMWSASDHYHKAMMSQGSVRYFYLYLAVSTALIGLAFVEISEEVYPEKHWRQWVMSLFSPKKG